MLAPEGSLEVLSSAPSFYRPCTCDPRRGEGLPQVTQQTRGRAGAEIGMFQEILQA